MATEVKQVLLENGEGSEENENEPNDKRVEEKIGGKEDTPPENKPKNQPQNWPRPQNRPLLQQSPNPHPFRQDLPNQAEDQDRRRSVTFGPPIRKDFLENRPPIQQGVVIRRPSPWAVLRAKLPNSESLPVLRPRISNEHFIQRMQNPETAVRPPSTRPPLSRPGSQESIRPPPYIQRNDSVVGRPPSSPRPSHNPMRPPIRSPSSSKDEEDDVNTNEIRTIQTSPSRLLSGQKVTVMQNSHSQNQVPITAQSPIIQITNPNLNNQMQPSRTQPNFQPAQVQNQNHVQQNHAQISAKIVPPTTQPSNSAPTNLIQAATNKAPVIGLINQAVTTPLVQGQTTQHPPTSELRQKTTQHSQENLMLNQPSSNEILLDRSPAQPPANNTIPTQNKIQTHLSPPAINETKPVSSISNSQSQIPAHPNSNESLNPPSQVGSMKPSSGPTSNSTPSLMIQKNQESPKQTPKIIQKEPDLQKQEHSPEIKYDNTYQNIAKDVKEQLPPQKQNGSIDKQQPKSPIKVDAVLKRPVDFKSSSHTGKAEETDRKTKENEPPKPESSKKESTSIKPQEPTVLNGNDKSPKKSKAIPPKKLGTAESPVKSPNKPLPKTPETPGTAEKKKVPMNKVQVGAAPSPNLKSVKSKIGSLDNAKHKPGGGQVKIEHRKLNFNVAPKIAAKNETYSPGGGDKKIQQVKLQWNAKPKIGSLDNAAYKPGGGEKKIESVKLDFKEKAKPKVGSKDNMKHIPGGGTVKNSEEHQGNESDIEDQKLDIKAQSKIGSMDNLKYKPGGGDKKIFDDKDYLKQMASTSTDSLNQERKKRSRCNSSSSEDKTGSKISLKSEGPKEQSKEKLAQRPIDQNSNQVNDKNSIEPHLNNTKNEELTYSYNNKSQIQTNGLHYQDPKKDANGNGKVKETVKNESFENEIKPKEIHNDSLKNQVSNNRTPETKPTPTMLSILDDKKLSSQTVCPPNSGAPLTKEPVHKINSNDTLNINLARSGEHPNISRSHNPPIQNPQRNNTGLPPNVRLAKDLINDTFKNEKDSFFDKSQTEKTEKETYKSPNGPTASK